MNVERLKAKARVANLEKDWKRLDKIIAMLEVTWPDDHAAQRFYTELEQVHLLDER